MDCKLRMVTRLLLIIPLSLFACNTPRKIASGASAGKRKPDLYLLIGQSNMAGRAPVGAAEEDTLDHVILFTGDGWEKAANPLNKYSTVRKSLAMQRLGPGYSFAKKIQKWTGREIGLIVNARGGTKIQCWQKGYTGPDDYDLYEEAVKRAGDAEQYGNLKAIIWHQGENNHEESGIYISYLKQLVGDLRNDLGRQAFFVAGELGKWRSEYAKMNHVMREIPKEIGNSAVVTTDGLTPLNGDTTNPHFDTRSQIILGERYADKVLKRIYDIDPTPEYSLLSYTDSSGRLHPVKTKVEWQIKRNQILDSMQAAMGDLPDRTDLPPLNVKFIDSIKGAGYTRYTIRFTVAKGERLPAYLYIPFSASNVHKCPAMLALHPTGKLGKGIVDGKSIPNRAYAKELAERGYVVIAPDYPGFGDLRNYDFKSDRYQSGTMKSIFDDMRCVDLLQERKEVNPEKIGVIGHSLGGHSAIFVGAFDSRLKVIISSCGWTLMHYYFNGNMKAAKEQGGKLWPWAQERYMPLIRTKYHLDPDRIPFDFDEVIAALAPRAFFCNAPVYDHNFNVVGVVKGMERISKIYSLFGAEKEIKVTHPLSQHDFPPRARTEAYHFIDKVFNFKPVKKVIHF